MISLESMQENDFEEPEGPGSGANQTWVVAEDDDVGEDEEGIENAGLSI